MAQTRIIIIGGGFAGVKCASTLRHELDKHQYEIVVFSGENHMVFYPLLAEVAAAAMNPKDMAAPLRQLLKDVHCRTEEIVEIDLKNNQVIYECSSGTNKPMSYDHLVIASGNTTNLAFIPGMADHALPLKSVSDALNIQDRIINQLEKAEIAETSEKKKHLLSFVIVGGGFSGVEVAGEVNDLVKSSSRFYANFTKEDVTVTLVHSHSQILPEVSSGLRDFAKQKMEENGIQFKLNTSATVCTPEGVGLKDGTSIKAGTVICTIGSRALPMIERLEVPKEKGRLITESDMSVPGFQNVWAIGDCALVMNAADKSASPTTGQFAERQGAQVAHNIVCRLRKLPTKPFSHISLGTLCSIGGKNAVAEMFNIRISGFPAWFVWRGVYLVKLPSLSQKIKVAVGWAFDMLFPPQLTSIKADSSKKLGRAHYKAGDTIFIDGDPATDFYVVEEGQVEILSKTNGKAETIAILGVGDFFGESSLMARRVHKHSAKARTDCEIMVMGKNIFNEISEHLTPFKQALAMAAKRQTQILQNVPEITDAIQRIPLSNFLEPLISQPVTTQTTLIEVVSIVNHKRLDYAYVVDEQEKLIGLVTRTDLMRWAEAIAAQPDKETGLKLKVKDLMTSAPITVTNHDSTANALMVMREHGFKRLPVVDHKNGSLVGMLRIENIMEQILLDASKSREGAETVR